MTDKQWEKVKGLLPPERKPQGGRPAKDNRVMLNGIIYWLATGIPWRDLPERFGSWESVYGRFRTWTKGYDSEDFVTYLPLCRRHCLSAYYIRRLNNA